MENNNNINGRHNKEILDMKLHDSIFGSNQPQLITEFSNKMNKPAFTFTAISEKLKAFFRRVFLL